MEDAGAIVSESWRQQQRNGGREAKAPKFHFANMITLCYTFWAVVSHSCPFVCWDTFYHLVFDNEMWETSKYGDDVPSDTPEIGYIVLVGWREKGKCYIFLSLLSVNKQSNAPWYWHPPKSLMDRKFWISQERKTPFHTSADDDSKRVKVVNWANEKGLCDNNFFKQTLNHPTISLPVYACQGEKFPKV